MATIHLNTENRTFRQLLGNGLTYCVPAFQRDYSWEQEQWEDLWADLVSGEDDFHYLGYLVLRSSDFRKFEVIDGQQRLTTITLIILAVLKHLKNLIAIGVEAGANQQRCEQLRQSYIGFLDPVTLVTFNKLSLNRNNNDYFRDHLVALTHPLPRRGFSASTHLLRKAFEFFYRQIGLKMGQGLAGQSLAEFVEHISDRLLFTVITVGDELNAYKVFETLNARGVQLSTTDLLKNYLFSLLDREQKTQLPDLERRWEQMVGRLGSEELPDFVRYHWNSRQHLVRKSELFKAIRSQIQDRASAFELVRQLDGDIDTYLALTEPSASDWNPEDRGSAEELRMFSVRQPYSMLLAGKRHLSPEHFSLLLRAAVVISFRYNVICGLNPSEQESIYQEVALELEKKRQASFPGLFHSLKKIYPSDEVFKNSFAMKSIRTSQVRNAKIVRYLLAKLDRQQSHILLEGQQYSLEHILPQNPTGGWRHFPESEHEVFVFRLGNFALLETKCNRNLGNQDYAGKRKAYLASSVPATRELAEDYDEWSPSALNSRQQSMAKVATAVWKLDQLA